MRKIIIINGLLFCATMMFAQSQSACDDTVKQMVEQYAYAKYGDIFNHIDFSASHWQKVANNDADADKRLKDLQKLAQLLAEKLKISTPRVDYLKIGGIRQGSESLFVMDGEVVEKEEGAAGQFVNDLNSIYYEEVQINKAYLKTKSAEKVIHILAHEVYHKYQKSEIDKLNRNEPTTVPKETVEKWRNDFRDAHYKYLIDRMDKKTKQLKNTTNPKERELLEFYIKMAREEYSLFQIEKDAESFGEKIEKVYNR